MKNYIFLFLISIFLISCSNKKSEEKWNIFLYPDKDNIKRSLKSNKVFSTLKECKENVKKYIVEKKLNDTTISKCGKNCKFHEGMKVEICEEMITF